MASVGLMRTNKNSIENKKAFTELLKIGIDKETMKKRQEFMGDAREKYRDDVFEDEQKLYIK